MAAPAALGGEVSATARGPGAPRPSCRCRCRRRYGRPPAPPRREGISGGRCDCPCGPGGARPTPRVRRHSSRAAAAAAPPPRAPGLPPAPAAPAPARRLRLRLLLPPPRRSPQHRLRSPDEVSPAAARVRGRLPRAGPRRAAPAAAPAPVRRDKSIPLRGGAWARGPPPTPGRERALQAPVQKAMGGLPPF